MEFVCQLVTSISGIRPESHSMQDLEDKLAVFRSDYEYEIEYEYEFDFPISDMFPEPLLHPFADQ